MSRTPRTPVSASLPFARHALAGPYRDRIEGGCVVLVTYQPCPKCQHQEARVAGGSFGSLGGHRMKFRCDSADCGHEFSVLLYERIHVAPATRRTIASADRTTGPTTQGES